MQKNISDLPDHARVWVYTAGRELTEDESQEINTILAQFTSKWLSHQIPVPAHAQVLHNRFLLLMADESQHGVSGCSTDSSVNLVKSIGQKYEIDFFDRFVFVFKDENGAIHGMKKEAMADLYKAGKVSDETLVFDGLIKTKSDFEKKWLVPLKESWHLRFM